ncbi:sugar ABC transporter permease [Clostridia bacterium]|nr:sugar ABC transporter permease [Clostridia bacterium]
MTTNSVRKKQLRIADSKSDKVFNVINYLFLIAILFIIAYPLYYILIASFSDPYQVYAGNTFWKPAGFSFEGYKRIFQDNSIVSGYINSIIYTVVGTVVTVFLIITSSYALSKKNLPGRKLIMLLFVFTMYFNGGLIPTYMVVQKLKLMNSVWALVLPGSISVFNMIVARTFFETSIPESLTEAAAIDGCSHLRSFVSIILPLAKPIVAVMVVFNMVNFWNDWFNALIYISNNTMHPLQLVLRKILIQSQAAANMMDGMTSYADKNRITEMIKFSSIVVASVPMLIVYPFVQKHFNKGVMIGAVKG